jgi:hypothetical protein
MGNDAAQSRDVSRARDVVKSERGLALRRKGLVPRTLRPIAPTEGTRYGDVTAEGSRYGDVPKRDYASWVDRWDRKCTVICRPGSALPPLEALGDGRVLVVELYAPAIRTAEEANVPQPLATLGQIAEKTHPFA